MIVSANGQSVSAPLAGVPTVDASGQGGLLDVALDPDFATNRLVYLAYSELVNGANGTAVARGTLNAARTGLDNVQVIFRQEPKKTGTSAHYGSRLVFRGDGTLFVTLGERQSYATEAQSLALAAGQGGAHPPGRKPSSRQPVRRAGRTRRCRVDLRAPQSRRPRHCIRPPASCGSPSTGPRAATR